MSRDRQHYSKFGAEDQKMLRNNAKKQRLYDNAQSIQWKRDVNGVDGRLIGY